MTVADLLKSNNRLLHTIEGTIRIRSTCVLSTNIVLASNVLLYLPQNFNANISRGPDVSITPLIHSFHRFSIVLIQLFSSNKYNCTFKYKFCDCSWPIKATTGYQIQTNVRLGLHTCVLNTNTVLALKALYYIYLNL